MSDWIEWKGGECPIDDDHVDVRLRNGDELHSWHCDHLKWGRDIPKGDQIIAYRVVQS